MRVITLDECHEAYVATGDFDEHAGIQDEWHRRGVTHL
jgi:hypothetical protein